MAAAARGGREMMRLGPARHQKAEMHAATRQAWQARGKRRATRSRGTLRFRGDGGSERACNHARRSIDAPRSSVSGPRRVDGGRGPLTDRGPSTRLGASVSGPRPVDGEGVLR